MTKAIAVSTPARAGRPLAYYAPHALVGLALLLIGYNLFVQPIGAFPAEWNLGLRGPLDEFKKWVVGNRATSPAFLFFFDPIADGMDFVISQAETFLLWLPWPVVIATFFLLGNRFGGLRLGMGAAFCLLFMGLFGLWDASMATLALMLAAVAIALLIAIPMGVWVARSDRAEAFMRPILDGMQTMPAFVYLIPVVLFFGIGPVPAAIAAVIYAVPPAVRLTNLGLRRVADDVVEAADAFGSTPRQLLFKVQIPQALPSILTGVNQTIMMALSIVIIAALVGAGGLGDVVLRSLRRLDVGVALEAGLTIVLMAILLDRLSYAIGQISYVSVARFEGFRLLPEQWQRYGWARRVERAIDRVYAFWRGVGSRLPGAAGRRSYLLLSLAVLLTLSALCFAAGWTEFPETWYLSLAAPVNAAVKWMQVNLYEIGETGIGTGPFSDFISLFILAPPPFHRNHPVACPDPAGGRGSLVAGKLETGAHLCPLADLHRLVGDVDGDGGYLHPGAGRGDRHRGHRRAAGHLGGAAAHGGARHAPDPGLFADDPQLCLPGAGDHALQRGPRARHHRVRALRAAAADPPHHAGHPSGGRGRSGGGRLLRLHAHADAEQGAVSPGAAADHARRQPGDHDGAVDGDHRRHGGRRRAWPGGGRRDAEQPHGAERRGWSGHRHPGDHVRPADPGPRAADGGEGAFEFVTGDR